MKDTVYIASIFDSFGEDQPAQIRSEYIFWDKSAGQQFIKTEMDNFKNAKENRGCLTQTSELPQLNLTKIIVERSEKTITRTFRLDEFIRK